MPLDAPLSSLPAAALVFPLLVAIALLASGGSALLSHRRRAGEAVGSLLPWIRVACGLVLLVSSGGTFSVCALLAVALCASALWSALTAYSHRSHQGSAARVAGAAALLAFAAVTAAEGLLGYEGVSPQLSGFELRDLSWAAATIGVLVVSILLQRGRADPPPAASIASHTDGAPAALDARTRG
jgi:hypothetical protein